MKPAPYTIYIRQGATLRYLMQFAFDCTDKTVLAQLWTRNRKTKLADFTIEWVNRVTGIFYLVLPYTITATITEEALWELMVIENLSQERQYYLTGLADWVPGSILPEPEAP
jgi:hypothetical protein